MKEVWIDTPLGPMLAIGDEEYLYLLEFADMHGLEREVKQLQKETASSIVSGWTEPLRSIRRELDQYFRKDSFIFKTPIKMLRTPFRKLVWEELLKIPAGETRSYAEIARQLRRPTAFRAVAQANGANQLAIIIPCHRVICSNGELGGYSSGVAKKQWLLQHESNNF